VTAHGPAHVPMRYWGLGQTLTIHLPTQSPRTSPPHTFYTHPTPPHSLHVPYALHYARPRVSEVLREASIHRLRRTWADSLPTPPQSTRSVDTCPNPPQSTRTPHPHTVYTILRDVVVGPRVSEALREHFIHRLRSAGPASPEHAQTHQAALKKRGL